MARFESAFITNHGLSVSCSSFDFGFQSVLHLNKAIQVDLETYGFIGVTPVTLHFVNCSGETPEHPWLTLFEVNPFAEILSGDTLQTVPKPKPFWNALYYSPGFEGKANAEIRVEGRDKPNDTLQFAAGSCSFCVSCSEVLHLISQFTFFLLTCRSESLSGAEPGDRLQDCQEGGHEHSHLRVEEIHWR
jgi:hypothetical protein